MANRALSKLLLPLALVLHLSTSSDAQGLKVGFYQATCPNAEAIIRKEMTQIIKIAPSLSGPLLRMNFHDCFVRGCDASILLNGTATSPAEKDAIPNQSLRGFDVIDRVKAKLEAACPGIVSCADIIAIVARDVVYLTKGPSWPVWTGRRDGNISVASEALSNLPPPFFNASQNLNEFFIPKGLSDKDMVVLSGAHTIGISHCSSFSSRLYNFTGKGDQDPSIHRHYATLLKKICKPNDQTTTVEMDPGSSKVFDLGYFKDVRERRGLFVSDATLLLDSSDKAYIDRQAKASGPSEFFQDFAVSMVKMANIQVLTGNQGEIRKHCAFVN